jgi:hypothetical protein
LNEKTNPPTSQREHMRVALDAAERLRADHYVAPPRSLTIQGPAFDSGPYSLELSFHNNPELLAEWADVLGLTVTVRDLAGCHDPLAEARGEVYGVQVRLWALGHEPEQARYRACASESDGPVGLPTEWSAAVTA